MPGYRLLTLLILAVLVLAACSSAAPAPATATQPPPTTPARTAALTSTSAIDKTPTIADATSGPLVFPETPCCLGKELEDGVYRTPEWFPIPFTATLGEGWRGMRIHNSVWLVKGPSTIGSHGESRATNWLAFDPISLDDLTPDQVWAALRATPGLIVSEDSEVVIFQPGSQSDASNSGVRKMIFTRLFHPFAGHLSAKG